MPLFRVQSQSLRAREIPRGGEGGRQFKNEAISEGVGVAFRGVFPEALCKIGELSVASYNMHTFQNFLAVLPPPHTIQSWNSAKILDTRVQHRFWGEGRGWTCVNWKTPLKRESVPRLLSMIEGSEFKTYCRRCYKFLGKPWPAMKEYHFLKPIFHHFHAMKR